MIIVCLSLGNEKHQIPSICVTIGLRMTESRPRAKTWGSVIVYQVDITTKEES